VIQHFTLVPFIREGKEKRLRFLPHPRCHYPLKGMDKREVSGNRRDKKGRKTHSSYSSGKGGEEEKGECDSSLRSWQKREGEKKGGLCRTQKKGERKGNSSEKTEKDDGGETARLLAAPQVVKKRRGFITSIFAKEGGEEKKRFPMGMEKKVKELAGRRRRGKKEEGARILHSSLKKGKEGRKRYSQLG